MTSLIRVEVDPDNSQFDFTFAGTFPSGVEWFIGIEGPFGEIKAINFSSPDATGASATASVVSSDPIQAGEYHLTVYDWPVDGPGDARPPRVLHQYTLCYEPSRPFVLSVSDDCVNLTIRDATQYPTLASLVDFSRTIELGYPFIDGLVTPPNETFNAQTNVVSMAQPDGKVYEFVNWSVKGSSSGTFSFTSGVWDIRYGIAYTQDAVSYYVQCSLDLCAAVSCVDTFWSNLAAKACNVGGLSKLPADEFDKVAALIGHLSLYAHYVNCNDRPNSVKYYNLIKDITGQDCTIGEEPSVVKHPMPGQRIWYPVASDEMANSHEPTGLAASITNGMLVFKGTFTGGAFLAAGEEVISKDFFDRIGVSLTNANSITFVDDSDVVFAGIAYPENGALWVKPTTLAFDSASDFAFNGTIAIEIVQ
jgi:hypothetical protein